jgi:PAS domain S-box-containing protein
MELMMNNKPYLIFLTHEDKEFESKIKDLILNNIHNVKVKTFESRSKILYDKDIDEVDLIIIDLLFDEEKLESINQALMTIHHNNYTPYLLFINKSDFKAEKLSFAKEYKNLICEFVDERDFDDFIFINRVKVLLGIPKISKEADIKKEQIQNNIWKILDYCNLFIVMLDKNLNIKIVNYHLMKVLGYDNDEKLIGENWSKFLTNVDLDLIKHVHEEILSGSTLYKEFTNDIIDGNKKTITVKWFNSYINSEFNCIFSIGIPLTKEPSLEDDIDSLRTYFKDILDKDKTTIMALKEVTLKYSEKILNENKRKRRSTDV